VKATLDRTGHGSAVEGYYQYSIGPQVIIDDIIHYQKIVVALKETMRLMEEIDALIPSWPIE
jgi:hypothetical protein